MSTPRPFDDRTDRRRTTAVKFGGRFRCHVLIRGRASRSKTAHGLCNAMIQRAINNSKTISRSLAFGHDGHLSFAGLSDVVTVAVMGHDDSSGRIVIRTFAVHAEQM